MERKERHRILIDLEKLNRLSEGCLACGHRFCLGDEVVLARGKWDGFKYIHKNEAVLEKASDTHFERKYYGALRKSSADQD